MKRIKKWIKVKTTEARVTTSVVVVCLISAVLFYFKKADGYSGMEEFGSIVIAAMGAAFLYAIGALFPGADAS